MRKWLFNNPRFSTFVLVLTVMLSLMLVPISTSQNSEEIKTKLGDLEEDVSLLPLDEAFEKNIHAARGQRIGLTNKIKAVIHQIEAGAYKGAINKLENDLKNTIEAWITEDYEVSLIEKIDEIIKLIKGELPPPPFPDFSLEASPITLAIALSESDISVITIESLNGFKKLVDLTVHNVPAGVSTTLDPEQVAPPVNDTASSTLTISVDMSATIGTYVLTIYGTSNSLQHSIYITLEITEFPPPPDFSVEADPPSLIIVRGGSDKSAVTISSINGFNQQVDLAVTSTPILGVTTSLDPVQVTPPSDDFATSTLEIDVDFSATLGAYLLTVTGTCGMLEHSINIDLEVTLSPPPPDFTVEASVSSMQIEQGSSATSTILVTSLHDFNSPVDLSFTGVPQGVTATIDPNTVTPPPDDTTTATLAVDVDVTATPGTYVLTITGTSGAKEHSVDITLEVTRLPPTPDFAISASPTTLTIAKGDSATSTITISSFNGFSKSVELTVSGEPIGATATLDPTHVTPTADGATTSTLTITVAETAAPGTYELTLTGKSNALQHNATLSLEITTVPVPPDLEPPTVRIEEPANGSYVAGLVNIGVFIYDENFKIAELRIGNTLMASWTLGNVSTGEHAILWDTTLPEYPDNLYNITLSAEDKAGNSEETFVTIFVDNTEPTIETPHWNPEEPSVDTQVNITVKVSDGQAGSGIQNVTLWYLNTTVDDWQPISMSLNVTSGNWTATIPGQSTETTIEFYVEAFDNAGNKAVTDEYEYNVIAPAGIPLAWIVAIIFLIFAATAAVVLFSRKRRGEKQVTSSRA